MNNNSFSKPGFLIGFIANNNKIIKLLAAREAVLLVLYMAISAMTVNVFMQTRSLEEGSKIFGLAAMLDGTAERPYVYRQLLPIVANHIADIIPEEDQEAFVQYHLDKYHLKQQYFGKAKFTNENPESWVSSYAIKFHAVYLAIFLSLLGFAYILRFLVAEITPDKKSLASTAPLIFLLMLPMSFVHGSFFYDFPELFFLGALLLAAIKGHYYWWIILLPLAVINKESNILVPILYFPIIFHNSSNWRNKLNIGISWMLSLVAYFYIKNKFAGNPGETTIWQLWENIQFWTTPGNYFLWHDFYMPLIPFPRGLNVVLILLLFLLVSVSWRNVSTQLKELLAVSLVVNIPLWLLFCNQDEMRNLSFIFLPLFLVATHSLYRLLYEPLHPIIKQ